MKIRAISIAAVLAFAAAAGVSAQSPEHTFTASGANCTQIVWSQEILAKYPRIAVACKSVEQKNGKYYVKFEGTVKKVINKGEQVAIDFSNGKGAKPITMTPREGFTANIDGKQVPAKNLRPGDKLTFFIPDDRLTANFSNDDTTSAPMEEVPIIEPVQETAMAPAEAAMPHTGSVFPLLALLGGIMILLGATISTRRWMHRL
jgi:hypothetical protein